MAKTKKQKKEILKKLEEKISQAKSLIFVGYQKLKNKDQERLRKKSKEAGGEFIVTKKSLLKLAWQKMGLEKEILEKINQEIGLVIGYQDEIAPARICVDFANTNENFRIQTGFFNHHFVDLEEIKSIALIPSREVLRLRLLFLLKSPLNNFVNVLKGNLQSFVYILNLISQKK